MRRLRTAVLGLGRIGWQFHVPEVVKHTGFELVAVADPLEERLKEALAQWGVKGYAQWEVLLAKEKPDLVVIASPTQFHADQTLEAFRAGSDVFCDKPLAPSLAEVDRMIEGMKAHGRKLMVYQPHRATAEFTGLQGILASGLIGEVYMIKRACSAYVRRNDWQALRKHGGGMLNNYGAHYVDQLLSLAASRVRRVSCALRAVITLGDADDVVKAVLETESGWLLDIDINMAAAIPVPPWQVLGTRGTIVLDEPSKAWRVRYVEEGGLPALELQTGLAARERRYNEESAIPWQERLFPLSGALPVDFYQKCYDYYALGQPPLVPVAETREVMRVLEECRRSAGWA